MIFSKRSHDHELMACSEPSNGDDLDVGLRNGNFPSVRYESNHQIYQAEQRRREQEPSDVGWRSRRNAHGLTAA